MMKIKMKVKTILWILAGLLFFIFIIVPFANVKIAYNLKDSKPEISEKLYKASLRYPINFMKDEALYNLSEDIMGGFGRDNVFLQARVGSKSLDYNTIISVTENYKKVIKDYPESKYFVPAYKGLMDSYIFLGDSGNLEKWIDWGRNNDKDEIKQMSMYYDGYNHFANREYEKAEEILERAVDLGNRELDYMYYFLKGHIEFMKEDFDHAAEYYGKASDIGWSHETQFFANYARNERKDWLEGLQYKNGKNKIKGRVLVENKGLPFVPVFLQYPDDGYRSSGGEPIGITDKDGYFETIGVKDGKYDIGVGVGSHILYDKVYLQRSEYTLNVSSDMEIDFKFTSPMKVLKPSPKQVVKEGKFTVEWEPVPGADYYHISTIVFSDEESSTGSSSFTMEQIKGENSKLNTKIDLDIDKLNNKPGMLTWSDDGPVNHEAILGYFYPGAERPIIVSAYDKGGNMLSSSMPSTTYYENVPSVKIEDGELTKGEKIILSKDYEGAIEYYEKILSEDKNKEEALEYLARIHMIDWKKDKKDISKSIDYAKRLYEINNDTKILERILMNMYPEDYIKYSDDVEEFLALIPRENMTDELYSSRGEYYRSIGEFKKAREDFLIAKYDHLYSDIVYIDLYFEEEDLAIDRLKKEKINFYTIDKTKLTKGIEGLSKVDKNGKEYKEFKEYLSSLLKREADYEERKVEFNKIYTNIKDPAIRIILNEIKADNY